MNRAVRGAQTRLMARNAERIRAAFRAAIDSQALVQAFFETHPAGGSITPQLARDWARVQANVDKKPLVEVLRRIYADGYVLGDVASRQQIALLIRRQKALKAPRVGVVNWQTWTPGNRAAAALLKPPGGLSTLLTRAGIVIDGVSDTKLNRIGTILSTALAQGLPPRRVAILIDQIVDDPSQALTIAQTETSRAVMTAQLDQYRETGVEKVEWLVADPCELCAENEAQSPIGINEEWRNGEPPVHPNCMCDVAPYIVVGDSEKSVNADIAKFVPSKEEAERAKSRLKILPNPTPGSIDPELNEEKFVESPWKTISVPTVDPNLWDDAELAIVAFENLLGTDPFLRRKKIKEHINTMGAALTPYRNFALVLERDGKQIIIDGHHRLMAMWLLGQTEAPVWLAKEK